MTKRLLAAVIVGVLAAAALTAGADRPPQEQYLLHCSGCHGRDGRGVPGTTPSLHGLAKLQGAPGGRAYLASVPGVAQAPLDDRSLASLLNWVLSEFSDTSTAAPYTAEEIGERRRQPLRDPASARPRREAIASVPAEPSGFAPAREAAP